MKKYETRTTTKESMEKFVDFMMTKINQDHVIIDGKKRKGITGIVTVLKNGGFPTVGTGGTWCRNQIVTPEEYEERKAEIEGYHYDMIDSGEMQENSPCYTYFEFYKEEFGNWVFLYYRDGFGNLNTDCFTYKENAKELMSEK